VIVFCGSGNNAGDGYIIAELVLKSARSVQVVYLSSPESLTGDALLAYQYFMSAGGALTEYVNTIELGHCVIVDALFGIGLDRQVTGQYAQTIELINHSDCPVVAVDIPSGLHANTGYLMGCAVKADHTVSFVGLKQGLFTGYAAEYGGKIHYSSLDIPEYIFDQVEYSAMLLKYAAMPRRDRCAHKGKYGHVLFIGGDVGFLGAIWLASEAALRSGAGLVSVATRKAHASLINVGRPELMCHGIENPDDLLPLLDKATVVVIGPGLGQSVWAENLLTAALKANKPLVCDADALNLVAKSDRYYDRWVLTPHPGEASRLLACSTDDIAQDRFSAVSSLQKQRGGVVVLKGAGTLISDGEDVVVSTTGNPGMASGGMGDVLSGMIGGLIAQQMDLMSATKAAVYLHGKSADLAAQKGGEVGLLASDLMPFIRQLINQE
jgi:NAD(P)H-hydrate epimerase